METKLISPGTANVSQEKARSDAIYRKVTWRLIPFLFMCYLLSFLDRINIGYAQLQMRQDLDLSDAAYGLGAGIFFVGYLFFEVPSNLLLERIGARKTISRIMFLWGFASAAMAFVQTPAHFYVVRFLLGAFEAGFFPGVVLYLTYWYPSARRAAVIAILLTTLIVAGLIAGPLSAAIMTGFHNSNGFRGWQWMFLLEGLPSPLLAVVAFFYLTDKPSEARWLTDDEKRLLAIELENDKKLRDGTGHTGWREILRNRNVIVLCVIYFCVLAGGYTLAFWLPLILRGFGVNDIMHIGLYALIPNSCGAVAMVWWGRRSDRKLERRWHFALGALVAASGFLSLTFAKGSLPFALAALCIAYAGMSAISPLFWSVPTGILSRTSAAVGIALISSLGQFGAVFAPWMIGLVKVRTGEIKFGLYLIAALLILGGLLMIIAIPAKAIREQRVS
ncbi:MFS transporter [Burkholderia lata]|uniref:MFS transporter n=1 Tax=Burkholderia lata (strain ATCC 17760 / DSM 23089 / LMG 22485 / NCIMB 9086 / R18194 / 383) TaxID=482957 RepID=A0A6P2RGG4_BURL3|nr:MFS transporter [Burkholderia lata]